MRDANAAALVQRLQPQCCIVSFKPCCDTGQLRLTATRRYSLYRDGSTPVKDISAARAQRLNIQIRHVERVLLDELAARLDEIAHQLREDRRPPR